MSDGPAVALSIAGSDSGAGAGIQADIKAMAALGVFATTAITAVTAQNTVAVTDVHVVPVEMVDRQITAVLADLPVAATKTGMLATAAITRTVARRAEAGDLPNLVVDPVMVASTGRVLLDEDGIAAYRDHLVGRALVLTPNLWEAALLAGLDASALASLDGMVAVAERLAGLGPRWVLVKGGHLPGVVPGSDLPSPHNVPDVLFDGRDVTVLEGAHVATANCHGTGCSLSAAIAALLALGIDVPSAVARAKSYVTGAIQGGARWHLGAGHGPLDHLGLEARDGTPAAPPAGTSTPATPAPT